MPAGRPTNIRGTGLISPVLAFILFASGTKIAFSFNLTNRIKNATLSVDRMMKRFAGWMIIAAALAASLTSASCSSPAIKDEIKFGIWATEHGLWDEAIFRWKKAVAANPRSAAALNNLAVAYEKKGLFEEALKSYEAALAVEPENEYVKSNYKSCQENAKSPPADEPAKPDAKKK
jgi:tetratricopeptide (TPR) repeat protein